MSDPDPVRKWVHDLQFGSEEEKEEARRQIFSRFYDSLVRLALSQMNPRLRRRADESRAASAVGSVFRVIEGGFVTPENEDAVWSKKARRGANRLSIGVCAALAGRISADSWS